MPAVEPIKNSMPVNKKQGTLVTYNSWSTFKNKYKFDSEFAYKLKIIKTKLFVVNFNLPGIPKWWLMVIKVRASSKHGRLFEKF